MGVEYQEKKDLLASRSCSKLLELAAIDDVAGFTCEVEEKGCDVDPLSYWYSRKIGSKMMGYKERTPLMVAALYGSINVLKYILATGKVDVNRPRGSDGATPLHCAVAGGSDKSVEVVRLLIEARSDINSVSANGKKPGDLIVSTDRKRKTLEMLLKGRWGEATEEEAVKDGKTTLEKKEYPVDVSLPDINSGIYGGDEFRMYTFKVKPCSRAYSHDWTECPFIHPGENARRRDPRRYNYTCVPCPEFKKGACVKGDACEYAHGVFESWLHPAQYRTRLCKDETGCSRKVCFFAHKHEELRPMCPSTGSALPSPNSHSASLGNIGTLSHLALGSNSMWMPPNLTPPMSPIAPNSSPMNTTMWQNKSNLTPLPLQLPGSCLKTASNARKLDVGMEMLGLESIHTQQQQRKQFLDEMACLSSPSIWNNEYNRIVDFQPNNLEDVFGSLDPSLVSQLQGLSPRVATATLAQMQTHQLRQNPNHLISPYPSNISSSPIQKPSTYGSDSSVAVGASVMNSRSVAFAKRSQSFIERTAVSNHRGANSPALNSSNFSEWGSLDGKLDWGFSREQQHMFQRSISFGYYNGNTASPKTGMALSSVDEPNVQRDVASTGGSRYMADPRRVGVHDMIPPWLDQLYREQEKIMA
ncbi:hypothetical protein LIER_09921 [Lithospermum erythrorhizon]|uniref:C3H1-type domain-containing protein n=1 Tax=Lithospermum erythrorhizon TaxID=34254 RepID=A0AAV3PHK4_LITER